MYSFISKIIIFILTAGLIISLGVGSEFISFGMGKDVVAKVGNMKISKQEFEFFKSKKLSELSLSPSSKSKKAFIEIIDYQIVEMIANRKVMAEKAIEIGLFVSDEEIRNQIFDNNFLGKIDGIKDPKKYKKIIKQTFNIDWDIFEAILREEALSDKLDSFIKQSAHINQNQIYDEFLKSELKLNFIRISLNTQLEVQETFDKNQIDEFISNNSNMINNKIKYTDVVVISPDDLNRNIEINDKDIKSYHENYMSNEPYDKSFIIKRIKKEIGSKKIISELPIVKKLSLDSSLKEISKRYEVDFLTINNSSNNLPDHINSKLIDLKGTEIFYYDDKIWILSPSQNAYENPEYIVSLMKNRLRKKAESEFYQDLIDIYNENPKEFLKIIKSDDKIDLQFYYDESAKYNSTIADFIYLPDSSSVKKTPFLVNKKFKDYGYYLVYVEKIRLPNKDLYEFEKDRIGRELLREKSEYYSSNLKKEIISNIKVKLNNKYFDSN
tara:strand:- start:31390 stop:32877 length:1488 start_codon:yes stop_codon:yes gene_type:complete